MFEQLTHSLLHDLKTAIPTSTADLPEKELRSLLESAVRKMNLVSREEFDAQQAVLLRTREKLESLQAQLTELEQQSTAASNQEK
ncbi:MAG: hypothetical protein CL693_06070 [Cellvibrionaceae bacterium]|nr:hypothetical protein [Cellvibrionaceae bacterium]